MGNARSSHASHHALDCEIEEKPEIEEIINSEIKDHEKQFYESQYAILRIENLELEEKFLRLKEELEYCQKNSNSENCNLSILARNLQEALQETTPTCEMPNFCDAKAVNERIHLFQNASTNEIYGKLKEKEAELEKNMAKLQTENKLQIEEIISLKQELEGFEEKLETEKELQNQEFKSEILLLTERYEEDKQALNEKWEAKLSETVEKHEENFDKFKENALKEREIMKTKFEKALRQLDDVQRKHKFLTEKYLDLKQLEKVQKATHWKDMEKIAELEGKLLIKSEEMFKKKHANNEFKSKSLNRIETQTGIQSKPNKKPSKKPQRKNSTISNCL